MSRNRASESQVERDFRRLVTMTPAQIRRWHKDSRSKEASLPHIRAELPLLARTKATPPSQWTAKMRDKARRAVAFIKRHEAQMKKQGKKYGTGRYRPVELGANHTRRRSAGPLGSAEDRW